MPRIALSARNGGKHRRDGRAGLMEYRGFDEIDFGGHRNWSLIIIFCAMPLGPLCVALWLLRLLAH